MKQKGSMNRNFFRQPKVRELVPDLKLLLGVLFVGCESHVGCWLPVGLSEDSGLADDALEGGLMVLEKGGHILYDKKTGEIFLIDFFRNNTFKTPSRIRQAITDFEIVESKMLKEKIIERITLSPECCLKKSDFDNNQHVTSQGEGKGEGEGEGEERARQARSRSDLSPLLKNKKTVVREAVLKPSGLTIRNPDDQILEGELVEKYGLEKVSAAAAELMVEQGAAWPSAVAKKLSGFTTQGKQRGSQITKNKWSGFEQKDYTAGVKSDFRF